MKSILKILVVSAIFSLEILTKEYKSFDNKTKIHTTHQEKKDLFASVGCTYSNKMIVDPSVSMISAYESQYFKDNKSTISSLSSRYKKDVENNVLAPMYLKFISPVIGYGVMAAAPITTDQFIGVYAGILRDIHWNKPGFKEDVDYAWYYAIPNKENQNMIVDGKYEGNELRFINHSENPNVKRIDIIVHGQFYICYVACKDIAKNEELTVSYGTGYWNSRGLIPEA